MTNKSVFLLSYCDYADEDKLAVCSSRKEAEKLKKQVRRSKYAKHWLHGGKYYIEEFEIDKPLWRDE